MTLTISKVRQNLFSLAEAAARGENVEFAYQGTTFRLVAEKKVSKLSRLKPLDILPPGVTFDDLEKALKENKKEALAAWERNQEKLETR
ncbi:MAG: hypothetical protein NTW74_17895 [Acidobacteria bacterium]|nr:hypothetical protein [Acidobacteriota bacterium]